MGACEVSGTEAGQRIAHVLLGADDGEEDEQDDDGVLAVEAIDKVITVAGAVAADDEMCEILEYVNHGCSQVVFLKPGTTKLRSKKNKYRKNSLEIAVEI